MSGWSTADSFMEEDVGNDFPAINNITVQGYLPSDQVPSPTKSRSLAEAHFKSLRLFRKYCRFMPWIIGYNGMRKYATPDQAKLQLREYWIQHNKMRSIESIDSFCQKGYERLYNMQNGDIWGANITDILAPQGGYSRENVSRNHGYDFHDEVVFKGKSNFLKTFYQGGEAKKPNV